MSVNVTSLSGNITRDAEVRRTQDGLAIATFGIAVNEWRKGGEYTNFFDLVLFGDRAESLKDSLTKGTKIAVGGKLHYSSWDDKQGNKRSKVEVYVDTIDFIGGKQQKQPQKQQGIYDEEIPF